MMATIKINVGAGSTKDCFIEANRIATLLGVTVEFEINKIICTLFPNTAAEDAQVLFEQACKYNQNSVCLFTKTFNH